MLLILAVRIFCPVPKIYLEMNYIATGKEAIVQHKANHKAERVVTERYSARQILLFLLLKGLPHVTRRVCGDAKAAEKWVAKQLKAEVTPDKSSNS